MTESRKKYPPNVNTSFCATPNASKKGEKNKNKTSLTKH